MEVVVWRCGTCNHDCVPIRSESRCLCGHRFREHEGRGGRCCCRSAKCACPAFYFIVAEGSWVLRCSCKHKHTEHDPVSKQCAKVTSTGRAEGVARRGAGASAGPNRRPPLRAGQLPLPAVPLPMGLQLRPSLGRAPSAGRHEARQGSTSRRAGACRQAETRSWRKGALYVCPRRRSRGSWPRTRTPPGSCRMSPWRRR